jgi:hypothetical protein
MSNSGEFRGGMIQPLADVYHQAAGSLAFQGALEHADRTIVEWAGAPVLPPLSPPTRYVPAGERMIRQDPLVGRPIQHEPPFYARSPRRLA